MAVFLLRGKHGAAYNPPPATGTIFTDVPVVGFRRRVDRASSPPRESRAAAAGGNYCPTAAVTRGQMAVFLSVTFALP